MTMRNKETMLQKKRRQLKKLIINLFFFFFPELECGGQPEYVFTRKPEEHGYRRIFMSAEWAFFIDECKKEFLSQLGMAKSNEDRIKVCLGYEGVVFVELAAKVKIKQLTETEERPMETVFGLSDNDLLEEARNGKVY